jgi:hypothetical protein
LICAETSENVLHVIQAVDKEPPMKKIETLHYQDTPFSDNKAFKVLCVMNLKLNNVIFAFKCIKIPKN